MKNIRKLTIVILIVLISGAIGFVGWATLNAQKATEPAITVLTENNIQLKNGLLVFQPNSTTDKGLIYYPGGLVDPEAYAVTAQGIADAGYLVVIPKMPLNLAFLEINRADGIIANYPDIDLWVIGGHSLGGAMAADYAKNNLDSVDGLIMFASYPANNEDFVNFSIPILVIIGSNDPGAPKQEAFYETVANSASLFIIEGGNHRQYADYSFQNNDGIATISAAEQQAKIIAAVVHFLDSISYP
jgi:hypothetical protein